jgi:molecular chaperone DnaK
MIEMKNEGESLIYNTEKQLNENDSKLSQEIKDKIRSDISALNEAISSNNHENTKKGLENLRNSAMEMGKAIYAQAGSSQQTTEQQNTTNPQEENKQ